MEIQDELELFFSKSVTVMFCSLDKNDPIGGQPLMFLLFTKTDDFIQRGIHKKISDYFNEHKSKLVIFVKNNVATHLSLVDLSTANSINLDDIILTGSIEEFIEETPQTEQIILLSTFISTNELLYSQEAVENIPSKIDGYSVVYI